MLPLKLSAGPPLSCAARRGTRVVRQRHVKLGKLAQMHWPPQLPPKGQRPWLYCTVKMRRVRQTLQRVRGHLLEATVLPVHHKTLLLRLQWPRHALQKRLQHCIRLHP